MSKSYKEESRLNWYRESGQPSGDDLKLGCLQRIADATEAMAKNHLQLQRDLDYYRKRCETLKQDNTRMARSINSLRGVITRLKRMAAAPAPDGEAA